METIVCLVKDEIVVYVVVRSIVSKEYLINSLVKLLPSYMIPSKILFLSSIPKLSNGKIDLIAIQKSSQSTNI